MSIAAGEPRRKDPATTLMYGSIPVAYGALLLSHPVAAFVVHGRTRRTPSPTTGTPN
jgi:hypothetical protein